MGAVLVNSFAIVAGGLLGLAFRKAVRREIFQEVLKAIGLAVLVFGFLGLIREMIYIEGGVLKSRHELLLLLSLAFGLLIGEALRIDARLDAFGNYLENRFRAKNFSKGFITSTMIFASGAMAIVGSIRAGLGDPSILYLKSAIDGITAILLASALGGGVLLSALSLFIYQGAIALLGYFFGDFLSREAISAFGAVGYALLVAIGIDFIFKNKIKPVNLTPALGVCLLFFLLKYLINVVL